jgi:hypothetical protein
MRKPVIIVVGLALVGLLLWGGSTAYKWTVMRNYVGHDEILIVTNLFGDALPPDRRTVKTGENFKGVQEDVLGPGRYFIDPIRFETRIEKQIVISAGDPSKWDWDALGSMRDVSVAPQVGIVTQLEGDEQPGGAEVVDPGFKGVQRVVLTPGTYKLNPVKFKIEVVPAVVVPPGSVGVVTRLVGDKVIETASQPLPTTTPVQPGVEPLVTSPTQRGILRDVIQPGIYYFNPRLAKVTVVPVGYDAITTRDETHGGGAHRRNMMNNAVRFYTSDGYLVEADFTVVWGRTPADAPLLVRNIGNVDRVSEIVIEPAMKAAAQNEGGRYTAKELIQGQTRSKFQDELSNALEAQVKTRNLQVLLALIRNITIKDNTTGKDQTDTLLATIQQANIEVERELTNQQKTVTATKRAEYEQALKLVDVARETVASDTSVKVANILADGEKKAAQITAQTEVEVARIKADVAMLEAQRVQILGKAGADVLRLKNDAEATGARLLVEALGSPAAYNQYIFARNFSPVELRLIFAGPGTFWTDLKTFQEIGAAQILSPSTRPSR